MLSCFFTVSSAASNDGMGQVWGGMGKKKPGRPSSAMAGQPGNNYYKLNLAGLALPKGFSEYNS